MALAAVKPGSFAGVSGICQKQAYKIEINEHQGST
jgi:hypothetical protein